MFNKNFYPTPRTLVSKMIQGLSFSHKSKVLDPSAGKGNILSVVFDQMHTRWDNSPQGIAKTKSRLFAIEIEPQLQAILKDQGFQVIDSDFLAHANERQYTHIIMNPPFDTGAKHLLKALDIGPYAEIRCLLNAETLNNVCSKEREVLQYALSQRDFDVVDLGAAFSSAERKTNVGVALVRVAAEKERNQFSFSYEPKTSGERLHTVADMANNQLESRDVFGSLVRRYNKVKELGAQIKTLQNEMLFYANGLVTRTGFIDDLTRSNYESFVDELRTRSWDNLYSQTQIANYVTSAVREQLEKDQESNAAAAFTEENICNLLLSLRGSLSDIRANCVQSAFDLLTKYHKENRVHIEGWKTNIAWKVNRKCILPGSIDSDFGSIKISWTRRRSMADIEKALCLLSGVQYSDVKDQCISNDDLRLADTGEWFDSYFFRFKGFKKGTMHIEFKSEELWKRFNYEACAGRNWLGGEFGGKAA